MGKSKESAMAAFFVAMADHELNQEKAQLQLKAGNATTSPVVRYAGSPGLLRDQSMG